MEKFCISLIIFLFLFIKTILSLDNGLGLTPQMGWSSWNHFTCSINDDIVRETADAFIANNLHKHGYVYVNIDDCWAKSRSSDGTIQPDPTTFPDMKELADYIHSKGLKFGMYSSAGYQTCAKRPASLNHETNDANTFAKWGVDYLKYDDCYGNGISYDVRYPAMSDALNKTGRPIFFSICAPGDHNPVTWAPKVGNSWRIATDIQNYWDSVISKVDANAPLWPYAGPGGWNDPDMLEVGNGNRLTYEESKSHFSLWALMKAPLLIGCDVRNMSNDTLSILTNDWVIAVNQDKLGIQGNRTKVNGTSEVWQIPLTGGNRAVIALNRGDASSDIIINWFDACLNNTIKVNAFDLWDNNKNIGSFTGSMTAKAIPSHGVAMYRLEPVNI